jgi:hypothetical protein
MPIVEPVTPLFDIKVEVPIERRTAYFEALAQFARENGPKFRASEIDRQREWFGTDILGDTVVAGGANIGDTGLFSLTFVPQIGKNPDPALVDRLRSSLLEQVSKVPGLKLKQ